MKRISKLKEKVTADKVYLLDLGGAEIQSTQPFKQRSKVGVTISTCIYIVILFYVIITIIQFSKGVPTVIYSSKLPSKFEPTSTLPLGIMFRNSSNGDYMDPSIATVAYTYVTITSQDALPRKKEPIESKSCEFTEDSVEKRNGGSARLLTEKAICPARSVTMVGTFELPTYSYLEVKIVKCSCTNISCPVTCASDEKFNTEFLSGSVSIVMTELIPTSNPLLNKFSIVPSVNLAESPVPINSTKSVFWKMLKGLTYNVDIFIRKQTIYNGPRYIFDSHYEEFFFLGSMEPRLEDFEPGNNILFKAYFRIDSYEDQEIRQSQQLLTLVGSWGGLLTFFQMSVVRIIRLYNRRLYKITDEINHAISKMLHINHTHKTDPNMYETEININNTNNGVGNGSNSVGSSPKLKPVAGSLDDETIIVKSGSVQSGLVKSISSNGSGGNNGNNNNLDSISNNRGNNDYHYEDGVELSTIIKNEQSKGNLEISWDLHQGGNYNNTSLSSMDDYNISNNSLNPNNSNNTNNNNENENVNNTSNNNINKTE